MFFWEFVSKNKLKLHADLRSDGRRGTDREADEQRRLARRSSRVRDY